MPTLAEFLDAAPPGEAGRLAAAIGVSASNISIWKRGVRLPPLEHCVFIENYTKCQVTREVLRPRDWQTVWPELKRRNRVDAA